jgi:hypothetical protein
MMGATNARPKGRVAFLCALILLVPGTALLDTVAPVSAQELDLAAIMPCGTPDLAGRQPPDQCTAARDLFMRDCTSCHSFVPIVRQQKDASGWDATMSRHQTRMDNATTGDLDLIRQFLQDHFRPDRPVPKLPQELIDNDPGFPPA